MKRSANLKAETQRKKDDHMYVLEAKVSDKKNCEDKLQKLIEEDVLDETYFANVSHEVFAKIKGDKLDIFILSRKQDVPKSKIPKK